MPGPLPRARPLTRSAATPPGCLRPPRAGPLRGSPPPPARWCRAAQSGRSGGGGRHRSRPLARPGGARPVPSRPAPSAGPPRPYYLLRLFPQRRRLRGGHVELPDSSAAVAAAPRTAEARGGGGRENRAVAHVPIASGPVELSVARRIRIYKCIRGQSARHDALPGGGRDRGGPGRGFKGAR